MKYWILIAVLSNGNYHMEKVLEFELINESNYIRECSEKAELLKLKVYSCVKAGNLLKLPPQK